MFSKIDENTRTPLVNLEEVVQEGLQLAHKEDNVLSSPIQDKSSLDETIGSLERITFEINFSTQCLVDLSSSLADLATEYFAEELPGDSNHSHLEVFQVSSPQAQTYCRKIRDRFCELPRYLVERLGEANAKRAAMIQAAQSRREELPNETNCMKGGESLFSSGVPKLTEITMSTRIQDSVFDISTPMPKDTYSKQVINFNDAASRATYASFSTSLSTTDQGRPRVPPVPEEAEKGLPFDCIACSTKLQGTDRRAWKYVQQPKHWDFES